MSDPIIKIADDFWNIRGSFKIGGLIDVGTQASLVRMGNGKYVFLDACTFNSRVKSEIDEITRGGEDIEAIINVHPFHTVYVEKMFEAYPQVSLYGTARHRSLLPDLPWEKISVEDARFHATFADDFDFSVPRGVDFISGNDKVHFSSVLVYHRPSKTIHVDDTLMYIRLPIALRLFGLTDAFSFHPTLDKALEKRAGAASDFRNWATSLAERWKEATSLCAAHTATLTDIAKRSLTIEERILKALDKVSDTLESHAKKYG